MSEQQQDVEAAPAAQARKPVFTKARVTAAAIGLGGMVLGSIVGIGVQKGVQSTGILGPSVEALIAAQQSNFNDINARLDELKNLPVDKEVKAGLDELGRVLARQDELARQANAEIAYLADQVASMREQQLAESGFSGGADFWLKSGESVTVGPERQVFGLLGARATIADINLSGSRKRVAVGDAIPLPGEQSACTIFYKQATPRADGRIGFDLNCS
ncbi:MAG TPA: hypothetical protein VLB07_05460 [Woeseiaceae bacterium]|nr:hypothetical protein [Woeseiaceae bacterium]